MISIESVREEKSYGGFFWNRCEIGRSLFYEKLGTCDICGNEYRWKYEKYVGLYTGLMQFDHCPKELLEIKWGYKNRVIDVCHFHKEREIDEKIKQLKADE